MPGLEDLASAELRAIGARAIRAAGPGELRFERRGDGQPLLELRLVSAVYAVASSGLPRPGALLDDGRIARLGQLVRRIQTWHPPGTFRTFRISAAGGDTSTFRRIIEQVAAATRLRLADDGGDLLLRVRRSADGFELLARLSPRPLSTRAWRVCNRPGALHACVAAAMAGLSTPDPSDIFLNVACGSGTLMVERQREGSYDRLIGCDLDEAALDCARQNLDAAGVTADLHPWDATALPMPDASVTVVSVDLPFGQLVGSHERNRDLYPKMVAEAARVLQSGGRLVAITQQLREFERAIGGEARLGVERQLRVRLPTNAQPIVPAIYVLRRV